MKRLTTSILAASVALFVVTGCGPEEPKGPPPTYDFEIQVDTQLKDKDQKRDPLPGVPVNINGKQVGFTDGTGRFRAVLNEQAGKEVTISLGKVDGYRFDSDTKVTEKLQVKKSLDGNKMRGVPVLLNARAFSTRQTYYVWVHANCEHEYLEATACADLPVLRGDEVVMRTDRTGHAYFPITASSGKQVEVTIDTPTKQETIQAAKDRGDTNPEGFTMRPQDPTYQFKLGYEPKAFVLKEDFKDPEAEKEAERRAAARRRRQRQQQQQQQQQAEEESSGSGIDLWNQ
jgi:hypothetical protein